MNSDGVVLARRQSGGGAVYHDLGNTNFTFMSKRDLYDTHKNFEIIVKALKRFSIEAVQSGRNDILVDGKKVSGSAFRMTTKKAFHHGTLLIDANMGKIPTYLTPDKEKLESKGVRSVASRVANLTSFNPSLTHDNLSEAIIETFFETYNNEVPIEDLTIERLKEEKYLYDTYKKYSDWQWRFGTTPQFSTKMSQRFEWGKVELNFNVNNSTIKEVKIFSDALSIELIEYLEKSLVNLHYDPKVIEKKLLEGVEESLKDKIREVVDLIKREYA